MIGAVELQPGTLLDGWQIVRPLRTGGFGAVHHAEQHGKAVAIKVALHREESGDIGKTHARTLRELAVGLTLNHPHILPSSPEALRAWLQAVDMPAQRDE